MVKCCCVFSDRDEKFERKVSVTQFALKHAKHLFLKLGFSLWLPFWERNNKNIFAVWCTSAQGAKVVIIILTIYKSIHFNFFL